MKKVIVFAVSCLLLGFSLYSPAWSREPSKVAVIPFAVHGPADYAYLQDGIFDMLASRLARDRDVVVVDKRAVQNLRPDSAGSMDENTARALGRELNADYVLFGDLTVSGNNAILKATVVVVKDAGRPPSVYSQTRTLDDIVRDVGTLAENIGTQLFDRHAGAVASDRSRDATAVTAHPQRILLSGKDAETFLNLGPLEHRKISFWKSQDLPFVMRGMGVGDLDNDGRKELVLVTRTDIWIYRYVENQALEEVKHLKGEYVSDQLSVDTGDMNGNGIPEIYVSNITSGKIDSFVLEWNGSDYVRIAEHLPWYLRLITLHGNEQSIVGQYAGVGRPFQPELYELRWIDGRLHQKEQLLMPKGANVFNFAKADVDGDGRAEFLLIGDDSKLSVYGPSGDLLWTSKEPFGETLSFVIADPKRSPYEQRRYLPPRIIAAYINDDSRAEVIVSRSLLGETTWLTTSKGYTHNEICALAWDGAGLSEKWKTRRVSGLACDYQLLRSHGSGHYSLFAGIVLDTELWPFVSGTSTVIRYDLDGS